MTQNQYKCEICGASFQGEAELERHNRSMHSQFKCETCGEVFNSANELEVHSSIVHPELQGTQRS